MRVVGGGALVASSLLRLLVLDHHQLALAALHNLLENLLEVHRHAAERAFDVLVLLAVKPLDQLLRSEYGDAAPSVSFSWAKASLGSGT